MVIFTGPSPQKPKIGFLGSRELGLAARLGAGNLPGCPSVWLDLAGNFPAPTDSAAPRTSAPKNPILGFSRVFGLFKAFQRTRLKPPKNALLGFFEPQNRLQIQNWPRERFSNFFPKNRFLAIFGPFCLLGPAKRPKIAILRKIASIALKSHSWVKIDPKRRFSRSNWP